MQIKRFVEQYALPKLIIAVLITVQAAMLYASIPFPVHPFSPHNEDKPIVAMPPESLLNPPPPVVKTRPMLWTFRVGGAYMMEGTSNAAIPISNVETDLLLPPNSGQLNAAYQFAVQQVYSVDNYRYIEAFQPGVSVYFVYNKLQGEVLEFSQRNLNNFDYTYENYNTQVLFELDTVFKSPINFHPFLRLGIGVGFIGARYNDLVAPGGPEDAELHLPMQYNTKAAYLVGAGYFVNVYKDWRLGLNYEYRNTGVVQSTSEGLNGPINVKTNTQNGFLNITYIH